MMDAHESPVAVIENVEKSDQAHDSVAGLTAAAARWRRLAVMAAGVDDEQAVAAMKRAEDLEALAAEERRLQSGQ